MKEMSQTGDDSIFVRGNKYLVWTDDASNEAGNFLRIFGCNVQDFC